MSSVEIKSNCRYQISDDMVAREIEGDVLIIPLTSGVGNMEDELYTLNATAKLIWDMVQSSHTVSETIEKLSVSFPGEENQIEKDVKGLITELLDRGILVKR